MNHMNRLFDKRVLEQLGRQTRIHGLGWDEGVRGWVANAAQLGSGRGKGLVLAVLRFWRNAILERRRGHVEADLRNSTVINGGMGWLAQGARLVVSQNQRMHEVFVGGCKWLPRRFDWLARQKATTKG